MKLLDLLTKYRNLSQYTLADLILKNIEELKEEPVIRVTIKKAEELRKLRRVLKPEEYFMLQNALTIVETMLVEGEQ